MHSVDFVWKDLQAEPKIHAKRTACVDSAWNFGHGIMLSIVSFTLYIVCARINVTDTLRFCFGRLYHEKTKPYKRITMEELTTVLSI